MSYEPGLPKFEEGDEVMAPWGDDGYLYPAIIVEMRGSSVHVAYLDGDEGDAPVSALLRGREITVGSTVNVNWKGSGTYYEGVVKQRAGNAFFFHYEDGDQGWATIAQCRILAKNVMTAL